MPIDEAGGGPTSSGMDPGRRNNFRWTELYPGNDTILSNNCIHSRYVYLAILIDFDNSSNKKQV